MAKLLSKDKEIETLNKSYQNLQKNNEDKYMKMMQESQENWLKKI